MSLPFIKENLLDLLHKNRIAVYEKEVALIGRLLNRYLSQETSKSLPQKAQCGKGKSWVLWIIWALTFLKTGGRNELGELKIPFIL